MHTYTYINSRKFKKNQNTNLQILLVALTYDCFLMKAMLAKCLLKHEFLVSLLNAQHFIKIVMYMNIDD